MAANKNDEFRDPEYEAAFAEDKTSTDDGFGLMPGEEAQEDEPTAADAATTSSEPEGEPAAVVIVAEAAPGTVDATEEASENAQAAKEAKQVTDANNAEATDNKSAVTTTGEKEAAGGKGPVEGSPAEEAAESPKVEAAEQAAGEGGAADPYDLSDVPPEDMQKAKSWVGRLKKIEADLKAKSDAAGKSGDAAQTQGADALEKVSSDALAGGKDQLAEAADEMADKVASGEVDIDEGMKQLADDFGEPFVRLIEAAAARAANKAVGDRLGKVEEDTQGVISHLTSAAERSHFEQIYAKHPDFVQVSEEPGFQQFVDAQGAQDVVDNGGAQAINQLLDDYKASKEAAPAATASAAPADQAPPAAAAAPAQPAQDAVAAARDAVDPSAVDAAEGVRSAGLKLPEKPGRAQSDDFASAWDQF